METSPLTRSSLKPALPEHPAVVIEVGPMEGDQTKSLLRFKVEGGSWSFDATEDGVSMECTGAWEREGLIRALEFAARQLRAGD